MVEIGFSFTDKWPNSNSNSSFQFRAEDESDIFIELHQKEFRRNTPIPPDSNRIGAMTIQFTHKIKRFSWINIQHWQTIHIYETGFLQCVKAFVVRTVLSFVRCVWMCSINNNNQMDGMKTEKSFLLS